MLKAVCRPTLIIAIFILYALTNLLPFFLLSYWLLLRKKIVGTTRFSCNIQNQTFNWMRTGYSYTTIGLQITLEQVIRIKDMNIPSSAHQVALSSPLSSLRDTRPPWCRHIIFQWSRGEREHHVTLWSWDLNYEYLTCWVNKQYMQ